MRKRIVSSRLSARGLLFLVVLLLCVTGGPVLAQANGKVSVYVQGASAADSKAAAWFESAWIAALKKKHRTTEQALGGFPTEKTNLIKQAERLMKDGKKAFEELNPELASRKFRLAAKYLTRSIPYLQDLSKLSRVLLHVGVSDLLNGKKAKGQEAFRRACYYTPNITLKGVSNEKDKIKEFNAVCAKTRQRGVRRVVISSSPRGAVFVQGQFVGVTPLKANLKEGNNIITIVRNGYRLWGMDLDVTKDDQRVQATLVPLATRKSWQRSGRLAIADITKNKFTTPIESFGKLMGAGKLLLATVKLVKDKLVVKVAGYDLAQKKKISYGQTYYSYPADFAKVKALATGLINGQSPKTQLWPPPKIAKPDKPPVRRDPGKTGGKGGSKVKKGGGAGVAVGLTVTALLLAGGGVAAYFLFFNKPQCTNGSCMKITVVK